jgi:hypothetical protein
MTNCFSPYPCEACMAADFDHTALATNANLRLANLGQKFAA